MFLFIINIFCAAHRQVHEVEELLQHLSHDGEISFRQALSHGLHIHL